MLLNRGRRSTAIWKTTGRSWPKGYSDRVAPGGLSLALQKALRGAHAHQRTITRESIAEFIESLDVAESVKQELRQSLRKAIREYSNSRLVGAEFV